MISPTQNFRTIPALPNKHEIGILSQPSLRENIIKGRYADVEQYLDIQFRLMREDMFRYLRESVAEYKGKKMQRKRTMKLENGHVYFNVQIQSTAYSNAQYFSASVNIGQTVDWVKSKYLKPTSLLCLSKDNFKTFVFASVRSRSPTFGSSPRCSIEITLENPIDTSYFEFHLPYDVIETNSFYESYKYVFKKLQFYNNKNFPLSSCLIHFMDCDELPAYWLKGKTLIEMFANLIFENSEKHEFDKMLKELPKNFDEHQERALKMALSSTVSLIQGPPGTGKTFLGLKIVQWLVENASSHMSAPILVICYTNHALDQFLEGVLDFTQKVLRIGGQSKSDVLKPHNLYCVAQAEHFQRKARDGIISEDEMKSIEVCNLLNNRGTLKYYNPYFKEVKKLEASTGKISELIQNIDTDTLYSSTAVLEVFPEDCWTAVLGLSTLHPQKKQKCMGQFIMGIENWLGLMAPFAVICQQPSELLNEILKELYYYMQNDSAGNRCSNEPKKCNSNFSEANSFCRTVLYSLLRRGPVHTLPKNQDENFCMNDNIEREMTTYLKDRILNKNVMFNLLKKAVIQHLSLHNSWTSSENYEATSMWNLSFLNRWKLLLIWISKSKEKLRVRLENMVDSYKEKIKLRDDIKLEFHKALMQNADVVGLTTTGAAKNWSLLEKVGPRVVFAEEAAEVLEAHVATALTQSTQHLILIGDHKQLRPNPTVYELGKNYKLEISMFERLLINGVPSQCLQTQHRMRPCFAELLVPEIYTNLENHPSVLEYEDIKGMDKNMYFVTHDVFEDDNDDLHTHSNLHEALFIVNMCKYLTQQGYTSQNITVLALYGGQVKLLKELMSDKCLASINVTTVDNFQGEESDIILLSFVRSNKKKNLGFIKIDNRVCVALSRAKKGLYCVGNFKLFASHCKLWSKIISKIEHMGAISTSLPLRCQNHPSRLTLVASEKDFKKVVDGGCTIKCDFVFPCRHCCPRLCHPSENHGDIPCSYGCKSKNTYSNQSSKCYLPNSRYCSNLKLPVEVVSPYRVAENVIEKPATQTGAQRPNEKTNFMRIPIQGNDNGFSVASQNAIVSNGQIFDAATVRNCENMTSLTGAVNVQKAHFKNGYVPGVNVTEFVDDHEIHIKSSRCITNVHQVEHSLEDKSCNIL